MKVIETGLEIQGIAIEIGKEFETLKELYPDMSDELIHEAIEKGYEGKSLIPFELSDGTVISLISRPLTVSEYMALGPEQREYDLANRSVKKGEEDYQPYCLNCSTMARSVKKEYGFECPSCRNKTNISMFRLLDDIIDKRDIMLVDYSAVGEDPIRRASKLRKILDSRARNIDIAYMERSDELGYLMHKRGNSYEKIFVIIPTSMKMNGNYDAMLNSLYGKGLEAKDKISFYSVRYLQENIDDIFS